MTNKKTSRIKREEATASKLPILGKIKVGAKVPSANGKERPTSLDYFVATGKYTELFNQAYGDKPKKIEIFFISDDPIVSCLEQFECRNDQGRLTGYGDGEQFYIWNDVAKMYAAVTKTDETKQTIAAAGKWKPVLKIRFVIPKIKTVFGLWEFSTSGDKSSIPAIRDSFDEILNRVGRISGIPFDLCVEKVTSQKPGDKSLFPVVSMITNIGAENLQLLADHVISGTDLNKIGPITSERIQLLEGPNTSTIDVTHEEIK